MRITLLITLILLIVSKTVFSADYHLIKKVLIVVAMKEEAEPIIKILHLSPISALDPTLPIKAYAGHYANLKVELILNGEDPMYGVQNIGSQAAVLATYIGIKHFHPDLVMSVGTAGGRLVQDVKIGDIYISDKIYSYSRRFHSPDYKLYGAGGYHSMDIKSLVRRLNIKNGIVCSGDSFDEDETDRKIINKQGCMAIDMEAAGVAWVSMLTKTPMFAVKGITNYTAQVSAHDEFEKNYLMITKKLALKTKEILKQVESQESV